MASANSNRNKSQSANPAAWNLKEKLSSILSSPVHSGSHQSKDQEEPGTELENVEDWTLVDKPVMETASAEGTPTAPRKKTSTSSKSSPGLGPRSSSMSGTRSPRSVHSPSSLQRSTSNRMKKPTNLEVVQNGRSSQRSSSPSRGHPRSTSPGKNPRKSMLSSGRNASSPVNSNSSSPVPGSSQNGTKSGNDDSSLASKIRDTLRISRPKKKKGKGKGLAYSVTPVEINMNASSKYTDPFETSYAEGTDSKVGHDHDFKAASIPHNKPEYCDHCGETAWGLYRQVLKCAKCDFIVHRKCESQVVIDCSSRLERVLSHDKQVEDLEIIAASEEADKKESEQKESTPPLQEVVLRNHNSNSSMAANSRVTHLQADSSPSISRSVSSPASSQVTSPQQLLMEKTKLTRKIREYNRKTTPVNHIHLRSSHSDPSLIEYQGFIRVHMCVQRPIHVSTAITRTSWYRLMRPVKERTSADGMSDGFETAFYLPTDTNRLVHIINTTTTKELVAILLKKFCVTDNPKKFSLYEEYGTDCRRLFEEDHPLEIALDASCSQRNSKLVLRDNTYSTIQWDAFSLPELDNFMEILQREEEIYIKKLSERFAAWKQCITQVQKDKCMQDQQQQTRQNLKTNPPSIKTQPPENSPPRPRRMLPPTPAKVESVV